MDVVPHKPQRVDFISSLPYKTREYANEYTKRNHIANGPTNKIILIANDEEAKAQNRKLRKKFTTEDHTYCPLHWALKHFQ